jgi:Domain of Unknown Function (DUF1080)
MRWLIVAIALLIAPALLPAAGDKARTFTFAKDDVGKLPRGWKADHTGKGEGSVWKVVADDTAPSKTGYALAQTAEGPKQFFNLCVAEDTNYTDLELNVAFKAIKGKEDQGGGVVWRYKDADNYYICRMNPLEDNFRVYKVVGGVRMELATTKDDVKVPASEWHTIKATMKGDAIECFLDGKKYLEAKDDTFKGAGKVGLWSKADAQSHFDNLTVKGK